MMSLSKLQTEQAIGKTHVLNKMTNEVKGNKWARGFLFAGSLNSLVDWIDEQYGNPSLDLTKIEESVMYQKYAGDVGQEYVFVEFEGEKLLTEEEIGQLKFQLKYEFGKGVAWATLTGFLFAATAAITVKKKIGQAVNKKELEAVELCLRKRFLICLAKLECQTWCKGREWLPNGSS